MRCNFLLLSLLLPWVEPVTAAPFEDALRATVKLSGGPVTGTGFVIEKDEKHFLATAAHVMNDFKGEICQVVYRTEGGKRKEGNLKIRNGEKALWKRHETLDVAVIEWRMPEDADCLPFPFDRIATEDVAQKGIIGVGREICIPCYPIKIEANPSGWPLLRRGTIASHPLTPLKSAQTFLVDSSSFGGESGAPVVAWEGKDVLVVGVIIGMQRQTDRTKTPLEERISHLPLGLGIAVQSPYLRALLE